MEKEQVEKNEEQLKEEAKKISIKEGAAFSVMEGMGVRYITPYALALGAQNFMVGILSSLPALLGNFSQIKTIKLMRKYPRKKIVRSTTFLQAVSWIPIIFIGFLFMSNKISILTSSVLLIIFYTLMTTFGALANPAWNSWMKDVVKKSSGEYFGRKSRISGAIALISMLLAGFILDYFEKTNIFLGFAIIFSIATIGRIISSNYFVKKYEPELKYDEKTYFTFKQFAGKMLSNNFGHFVLFVSLITLATAIASPFFAVYMLKNLRLSYSAYTIVTISSIISTLIFLPFHGRLIDKHGSIKIMKISGALVALIPALWLAPEAISQNSVVAYLIIVEIFSGFIWAAFNLAASNFIYDAVTRQRMPICITYFNIINAFSALLGALLGGILSHYETIFSVSSILFVFALSAFVRLAVFFFISPSVKEVRPVEPISMKEVKQKMKIGTPNIIDLIGLKQLRTK